jgi:hypothetical protein
MCSFGFACSPVMVLGWKTNPDVYADFLDILTFVSWKWKPGRAAPFLYSFFYYDGSYFSPS